MNPDQKDTVLLDISEWKDLSSGLLKRLATHVNLEIPALIVELDNGSQAVALGLTDLRVIILKALEQGVKPETQLERQFIAICLQDSSIT